MSLVTNHWSGSVPIRLRAYHVEIARKTELPTEELHTLRQAWLAGASAVVNFPWLRTLFNVWKNDALTTANDYGTWQLNHDPRDQSPNIEVASMCLPGGATDFHGVEPFTIAHAWMHAYITAAICTLKNIDVPSSFDASVDGVLQNGPIFVVSTHGERAIQTKDYGIPGGAAISQAASDKYGYFFGSGDPDSRADLFCLDGQWYDGKVTVDQCKESAAQLREHARAIKAAGVHDFWGLDGAETP